MRRRRSSNASSGMSSWNGRTSVPVSTLAMPTSRSSVDPSIGRGPSHYGERGEFRRGRRTTATRQTIQGRHSQSPRCESMLFTTSVQIRLTRAAPPEPAAAFPQASRLPVWPLDGPSAWVSAPSDLRRKWLQIAGSPLTDSTRRPPSYDGGGRVGVVRDGPPGLAANRLKPWLTEALVDPTRAGRGVRLADGGRAGGLHPAL